MTRALSLTIPTTLSTHAGDETECEIDVRVHAGTPARRSGHPDTWEPAESAECEIVAVRVDGEELALTLDAAHERFVIDEDDVHERAIERLEDRDADRDCDDDYGYSIAVVL